MTIKYVIQTAWSYVCLAAFLLVVLAVMLLLFGCRLLSPDGEPHAPGRVDRDTFGVLTNSVTK